MPILALADAPARGLAARPQTSPAARRRDTRLRSFFPSVPSLRQLLARHPALLVIDACSPRVEAALWTTAGAATELPDRLPPTSRAVREGEASAALPEVVAEVLAATGKRIQDLDAIAFCDGPGSVLGIRLSAAALRAWRVVHPGLAPYSFHSLPLLAAAHPGLTIIADARRDSWHAVRPDSPRELLRLPSAELAGTGPLATPENFRRWSALPAGVEPRPLPYSAAALLAAAPDETFFADASEPEAFLHEQPAYAAWTPQVHQAPPAK